MKFSGYVVVCVNETSPERLIIEITSNFIDFMANKNGFLVYCQGVVNDDEEQLKELNTEVSDIRIKVLERMISFGKNPAMDQDAFQQHFELLVKETVMNAQFMANKHSWHAMH